MEILDKNSLLSFLIGMVFTLLLKSIASYIDKLQTLRMNTKNNYLNKKLHTAEKYIQGLSIAIKSATMMKIALKGLIKEDIDGVFFEKIWSQYYNDLLKVEDHIYFEAAQLYFNINNNLNWKEHNQKEYLECLSSIHVCFEIIRNCNKTKMQNPNNQEHINKLNTYLEEVIKPKLLDNFEDLEKSLGQYTTACRTLIREIKADVKEF
jgi:hypothetical protein